MKKIILYSIIFVAFAGCQGFVVEKEFKKNYYLVAPDVDEQLALSYHEATDGSDYGTIIEATVFAVGYNDKYIIVKQHPCRHPFEFDKTITNFYILPLKEGMNWRTNNGLMGPFTQDQFEQKRKELNIEDIKFTIIYKNLE